MAYIDGQEVLFSPNVNINGDNGEVMKELEKKVDKIENSSSSRYVYMIDKIGGNNKKIVLGMGSATKGVEMPSSGLMLPQYNNGKLCTNDPTSDYHAVNLKTLNEKNNILLTEITKISARLDSLTPSEPEVPTEFAWLDLTTLANAADVQKVFNNSYAYRFRGSLHTDEDFEGDGDLDMEIVRKGITFNFEVTPDSILNFSDNSIVTGAISNFTVDGYWDVENPYNPPYYWGFEIYSATLNNDTAVISVSNDGERIEICVAIDVSLAYFWENDGMERSGSGKFLLRTIWNTNEYLEWISTTEAYVGKTSETAPFFPQTMSLRQQSLNRQLIAFLEERKQSR